MSKRQRAGLAVMIFGVVFIDIAHHTDARIISLLTGLVCLVGGGLMWGND